MDGSNKRPDVCLIEVRYALTPACPCSLLLSAHPFAADVTCRSGPGSQA